jgi:hypothetical protein
MAVDSDPTIKENEQKNTRSNGNLKFSVTYSKYAAAIANKATKSPIVVYFKFA